MKPKFSNWKIWSQIVLQLYLTIIFSFVIIYNLRAKLLIFFFFESNLMKTNKK